MGKPAKQRFWCTQVPFESLKRTTRDRKGVVDEFTAIVGALQQTSGDGFTLERRAEVLDDVDRRVGSLKRKVCLELFLSHSAGCRSKD